MSLVRLPSGQSKSYGPKSIVSVLPSSRILLENVPKEFIYVQKQAVLLNNAPKAGQIWLVQGVYFNFPTAFTQNFDAVPGEPFPLEFVFEISLTFGSRVIAKQIFETSQGKDKEQHKWALTGNLEGFSDTIVYPAESITVNTRLTWGTFNEEKNSIGEVNDGESVTGKGEFVFTYTQRSH